MTDLPLPLDDPGYVMILQYDQEPEPMVEVPRQAISRLGTFPLLAGVVRLSAGSCRRRSRRWNIGAPSSTRPEGHAAKYPVNAAGGVDGQRKANIVNIVVSRSACSDGWPDCLSGKNIASP
jgi:hypothetical protein